MDWLSNLDPNLVIGAVTALLSVLGIRKANEKQANVSDALTSALRGAVIRLSQALDGTDAYFRAELDKAANKLLAQFGVKRSKSIDILVRAAIEAAMAELDERLDKLRLAAIDKALGAVADGAKKVADEFDAKTNPYARKVFEEVRAPEATVEQVYGNDPSEPALPGFDSATSANKVRAAIDKAKDPP